MDEFSKNIINLPKVAQIGIVVNNLEKSMEFYTKHFGLGPWKVIINEHLPYAIVRGEKTPYTVKCAFTSLPPFQLELMEVTKGPCTQLEYLENKGEGIHHIQFSVSDLDKEISHYQKHGFKIIQEMRSAKRGFFMVDTDKVGGIIFEIVCPSPSLEMKEQES